MNYRNKPAQWGCISIVMHWVVAVAVIGLFGLGLWMRSLGYYDPWYQKGPDIHRSVGVCLFLVIAFRLFWRYLTPPPLPLENHKRWEVKLSHRVHFLLYLLLFLVMISGYFIASADALPIAIFNWAEIPAIVLPIAQQEEVAGAAHYYLAVTMMLLVAVHALGALKHHFIDRDETLTRIIRLN